MILGDAPRRLGIYFFYDADGVVDSYVETMLADMVTNLDELTVVVNGALTDQGRQLFERYASRVIVRDNVGLDVWAYKTAMDSYGWQRLCEFDEIVLFNVTIMGPVYPFSEMFTEMAGRDVDFWGPTWFHAVPEGFKSEVDEESHPRHLQSHFHVYRRSLVSSQPFQEYWDHLPLIKNYIDSVSLHEIPFTRRFERLGFVADAYVDTSDLEGFTYQPILFAPKTLIADKRCPIFKRRSFFHDYEDTLDQSVGNATRELYEYLRDYTDYDTDLIWDNLLRTVNLADLTKNLQLTYVLPTAARQGEAQPGRVALIIHMYYMDLLPQMLRYASSMPEWADLIITVGSQEKALTIRQSTQGLPQRVIVRVVENRGRDVSALLVGVRDLVLDYDLVCFVHDKKVQQISPYSVGEGFAVRCFENILPTADFVSNVITTFQREPRLGVLAPTPPNHADYFPIYTYAWGPNMPRTKELLSDLGVSVPLSDEQEPVAPLGSTFWFRPEAVRPLFERQWQWEDFDPEPLPVDGTISHAIERSYCYLAQGRGYYSGWLFSDRFAQLELTNLSYYTRRFTDTVARRWQAGTAREMLWTVSYALSARQIVKARVGSLIPRPLRPAARSVYRAVRPRLRRR
ncbi:rhamnan synthesis F family protein [Actinomyces faecalis]|uniref:rhamnan synthesis F family protein n=1 Tax=Actinomyces faecalis TaxID=2722820 RepID=UPI0015575195|nr:rhamnan synthesis F family protein [Actinomyces faecalis]